MADLPKEKQVAFTNPAGERLAGTLHLPARPAARALAMGHCFTCSRHTRILSDICRGMSRAGFLALRFDFSGNGQSEGDFAASSYSKHMDEMRSAVEFLRREGCDWIGLAGHSMGAAIALLTAARHQGVKALCTLAGRYSGLNVRGLLDRLQARELADQGRVTFVSRGRALALHHTFFEDADRQDPAAALRNAACPILAVHGDMDEIIPVAEARHAAATRPDSVATAIIPGADHMFSRAEHREAVTALVTAWFLKQAPPEAG
ncbi:MAG: alpha/beta hydrolase [Thermodesulfobacteriota bacterium]